jgi:hypothetical protein
MRSNPMDRSRTNSALLVVLQRSERIPLHPQIATSIRDSISAGRLPRGSSLPSSHVLAADLLQQSSVDAPRGCLAWRCGRGLPAAGGRGLSGQPGRRVHAGGGWPGPSATALRLARPQPPRIDLSYGRADVVRQTATLHTAITQPTPPPPAADPASAAAAQMLPETQWLDSRPVPSLIQSMENNDVLGSKGPSRRAFLSASAVTAVAVPIVSRAAPAGAAQAITGSALPGH